MENFAPGLREGILDAAVAVRGIVFFVCVAGLVLQAQRSRGDVESLAGAIVRGTVVVALVATLPYWFGFAERIFLSLAETVNDGYAEHPMEVAVELREKVAGNTGEFSLRRVGESLYQAFLFGSAKLVVLVASLLQLPFLVLQFVLKLLSYLFLPVALGLFMLPGQAQLGARYIQQSIAILAWPVGFAVTELVAYHLLTAYGQNLAAAYGLKPGEIDAASFGSLLGALLASLWLILGTVGTPFLMQALICSGAPISGGAQAGLKEIFMVQQLARLVMAIKTGGVAAPALAASVVGRMSGGGGGPMLPPPPPAPPSSPGPVAPISSNGASVSRAADPAGDRQAASLLALARLPKPQTTI
jgi:hypothetical protein